MTMLSQGEMERQAPHSLSKISARRRTTDRVVTMSVYLAFAVALLPLISVLWLTVGKGLDRLDLTFLTHSLRNITVGSTGGGAYHAIIGTLEQVGIASVLAVPLGLVVAVYLVDFGSGRFGRTVSLFVDVMTGLPSIVAGLFVLAFWIVALHQNFSGFAGSLALAILMLPIVVRSAEEMLRLVPSALREAGLALGLPRWVTVLRIIFPVALPGIVTGVMLAVARVTGETAPLLLTVFGNDSINTNPFHGAQSGLPLFVFGQAGLSDNAAVARAWAGALTLIIIVVLLNVIARLVARRTKLARR